MAYPHIDTSADYAKYEQAVKEFFDREGINNLSTKYCEEHNGECDCYSEPYFSWRECDCCGRKLGGNRYDCAGYNHTSKEVQEYSVCADCVYYAEYGKLDDMTMISLKED